MPLREGLVENQSPPEGDQSAGQEQRPPRVPAQLSDATRKSEVRAVSLGRSRSPEGAATAPRGLPAAPLAHHGDAGIQFSLRSSLHPKLGYVNSFRQRKL